MANTYSQQFNPAFLSQNQQDLLMAALQSNGGAAASDGGDLDSNRNSLDFTGSLDPQMISNAETAGLYQDFEFDPHFLDTFEGDSQQLDLDFDDEGSPDGDVNPSAIESYGDQGEKRKTMADDKQDGDNGSKRREGDEKLAKKPGRKPLTSEPTSVSCD
jgi:AP-1-like factor